MEGYIERNTGIHIPHRTMHEILDADGEAQRITRGGRRRRWTRWECSHSDMMRHTDFGQLAGGRRFIGYEDDAPRYLPSHGVFDEAATANALAVPHAAIARHGRPASAMADHGSQFFANEAEGRRRGEAAFEAELTRLGIRHVLARIRHPQANGKIERVHKEIERRPASFEAESPRTATRRDRPGGHFTVGNPFHSKGPTDPIDRLVERYSYERDHMSLDEGETPAEAYARKMPPRGVHGHGRAVGYYP